MRKLFFSVCSVLAILGCGGENVDELPWLDSDARIYCRYSNMCEYMSANDCNYYGTNYGSDNTCGGFIQQYTVSFNSNGGSAVNSQTVNYGFMAIKPSPDPTRTGYIFAQWELNGTAYNFSTPVTHNITLTAKWNISHFNPNIQYTSFTDNRDYKTYKSVTIGNQTWMAENLNYDMPNNATDVCYNNNSENCGTYGRLYNWETAQSVCPYGWHLPSEAEWTALGNTVGGSSTAGNKLKSAVGWYSNSGTDNYGFSAIPGGSGLPYGSFFNVGRNGLWWSATEYDSDFAYYWCMRYLYSDVYRDLNDKSTLFSVRCVKD